MSPAFELRNRSGKEIRSPRGWGKRTKAGLARSWTSDHGLEALRLLLDEVTGTAGFEVKRGVAGVRTSFDAFRGPYSHDLLLIGQAGGGITVVGIEGKGDESFGQKLGEHRSAARRKIGSVKRRSQRASSGPRGARTSGGPMARSTSRRSTSDPRST